MKMASLPLLRHERGTAAAGLCRHHLRPFHTLSGATMAPIKCKYGHRVAQMALHCVLGHITDNAFFPFDEPLSNLNAILQVRMRMELSTIQCVPATGLVLSLSVVMLRACPFDTCKGISKYSLYLDRTLSLTCLAGFWMVSA